MTEPTRSGVIYRRFFRISLAFYWILLFIATHVPLQQTPEGLAQKLPSDKWLHFVAYAILSLLLAFAVGYRVQQPWMRFRLRVLIIAAVVPVYAMFDEVTQPITGRFFDLMDWLLDVVGALIAVGLLAGFTSLLSIRRLRK